MKRPRITIKDLMITVAIMDIMTWGGISLHRRWLLVPQFQFHAQHEKAVIIAVRERSHTAGLEESAAINER